MKISKGLEDIARGLKKRIGLYRLVLRHPDTPLFPKLLLGLAVAYTLMPFDLIPDFIPVLGQLDDLVIVPLLVIAALKLIPREIIAECERSIEAG